MSLSFSLLFRLLTPRKSSSSSSLKKGSFYESEEKTRQIKNGNNSKKVKNKDLLLHRSEEKDLFLFLSLDQTSCNDLCVTFFLSLSSVDLPQVQWSPTEHNPMHFLCLLSFVELDWLLIPPSSSRLVFPLDFVTRITSLSFAIHRRTILSLSLFSNKTVRRRRMLFVFNDSISLLVDWTKSFSSFPCIVGFHPTLKGSSPWTLLLPLLKNKPMRRIVLIGRETSDRAFALFLLSSAVGRPEEREQSSIIVVDIGCVSSDARVEEREKEREKEEKGQRRGKKDRSTNGHYSTVLNKPSFHVRETIGHQHFIILLLLLFLFLVRTARRRKKKEERRKRKRERREKGPTDGHQPSTIATATIVAAKGTPMPFFSPFLALLFSFSLSLSFSLHRPADWTMLVQQQHYENNT